MGIDKFPQELYKSYRNYLMKRYYAFFHVFFLMEITKTEKKSHVFAVAPHAGAWIEMFRDGIPWTDKGISRLFMDLLAFANLDGSFREKG